MPSFQRQKIPTPTDIISDIVCALPKAQNLSEIQSVILEVLKPFLQLESIEIKANPISKNKNEKDLNSSSQDQSEQLNKNKLDYIVEYKEHNKKIEFIFTKKTFIKTKDKDLFRKITQDCRVFASHILKVQEYEILQKQWKLIFDSIETSLCLVNKNFALIQWNKSFAKGCEISGYTYDKLCGKNPWKVFFNEEPVDLDKLLEEENLHIFQKLTNKIFHVKIEKIFTTVDKEEAIYLMSARDISNELKIEKQILESAKIAEMGIVSSSIAHEINNPLGGAISFLQLIKMESGKSSYVYENILKMEKAAMRCKEIVQDLLRFSRKSEESSLLAPSEDFYQIQKKILTKGTKEKS